MAVQIITDSTFDMATRFRDRVSVIPLRISFCERDYIDGVTLTRIKKQNKTGRGVFCLQAQAKGSSSFLAVAPFSINQFSINPLFRFINHN